MRVACPQCDLIVDVPRLLGKQVALCPHCHSHLDVADVNNDSKVIAFCIAAMIMLLSSIFYPFISFSSNGITQTITLPDAGRALFNYDSALLGLLIDVSIIVLPMVMLFSLIPLHLGVLKTLPKHIARRLLKWTFALETWVMSEIFLIGVLVSMIKIMSLADVSFGASFWAYAGFVVSYIGAFTYMNRARLWNQVTPAKQVEAPSGVRAIDVHLRACHVCHQLTYEKRCERCHTPTRFRNMKAVQHASAWLITSVILYIPANILPIMYTTSLGDTDPNTLIGGVVTLWQAQSYPVAIIIFLASVVVPVAKALVMGMLCIKVYRRASSRSKLYTRLYQVTEFIGKWSMIDVFVVALLVALVQLGNLMRVDPGLGILCFAAMVVCQIMAAHSFDPRLIWDPPELVKESK